MLELEIGEEIIPVLFGNDSLLENKLKEQGLKPLVINPPTALPVFVPSPDLAEKHDIKYSSPGAVVLELTPEVTTYHGLRVQSLHDDTLRIARMVIPSLEWPLERSNRSYAVQHILGLIDLSLKVVDAGKNVRVIWKYPESGLHPQHQLGLGDAIIAVRAYFSNLENSP